MEKTGCKHTDGRRLRQMEDAELVELAIGGRAEVYSIFVERYKGQIITFIEGIVAAGTKGLFDAESAEEPQDICQIAFQKAFSNIASYDRKYAFTTWLYNIAKNTAIDYLRRKRSDYELENVEGKIASKGGALLESSPEETVISTQTCGSIIEKIKNLPPRYSKVAELRFLEEYAIDEIAELLALDPNTVKTRIRRAKALLEGEIIM